MQQRQLRLGDILDDYCPRERRLTNHAVVAMVGDAVKQTRCTTCDAEHEFKHAKVPRQRKKSDLAVLSQPVTVAPKKVIPDAANEPSDFDHEPPEPVADGPDVVVAAVAAPEPLFADEAGADDPAPEEESVFEEGPVHRPLIRAQLPRTEGQPPAARPAPDFTIRQPTGRQNRFRPRQQRAGAPFFGNRSDGNGNVGRDNRGGPRSHGGRPGGPGMGKRQAPGRKRSK